MTENKLNAKYKILLIDDDKFLLDVYSVKFRENGHTVVTAFGGEEALEKMKEIDDFDAIVLDVVMPGMDGFDFLAEAKKRHLSEKSAFIVLSNQGEAKDIDKAKEYDVDGYIVKASTIPSDVLSEVLKVIEESKSHRG